MIRKLLAILLILLSTAMITSLKPATASQTSYDINTLAGKLASVDNTPGLLISLSGYLQQEADMSDQGTSSAAATSTSSSITPSYVLNSKLDGTTVKSPDVTVNQDTLAATQNEPTIAVDPNNPNRIVVGSNDYITRTWSCAISGTPCSALGDGYSGTYYSNDGGQTWCCVATDPTHLGTLIPGVERLTGGIYDAGGDSTVFFDNHGNVYFTGLGFDRTAPPNTVTLSKGAFDTSGALHWGSPTFIGQTTAPSTLNDKPWSAVDNNPSSSFYGRIYVSWTRFIFNPHTGGYVQSPIIFAYSTDGGQTFSTLQLISGNVLYGQGSHVMVGPDGTVYVLWDGDTRLGSFDSTWMTKSTDGGDTWTRPLAIAPLVDIHSPQNSVFRVNSFPAGAVAPNRDVYAAWSTEALNTATSYVVDATCFSSNTVCHAAVYWSKSTDAGASWSTPQLAFAALDASSRTAIGYPQAQPSGGTLNAPAAQRVDTFFPAVAIGSNNNFHAVWCDTNNVQTVVWWYGFQFVPTTVHQQDIVTATGTF